MNHEIFLFALGFLWILFASIQDWKHRMVANWINFSLIIFAMGYRFFYSLFEMNDFMFFYQGLIGLGIFFVIGNLLYYGRFFAGGDAKLMIALGAVLPMSNFLSINIQEFTYFLFFMIFLFVGAAYGLIWSFFMFFGDYKKSMKKLSEKIKSSKKSLILGLAISLTIMLFGFYDFIFVYFSVLVFFIPYLYLFAKTIDETCFVKMVNVSKLEEGDWLYQKVRIGKGFIQPNWHGLTKDQIKQIKKKYSSVKIKEGIPFVPSFLISFVIFCFAYFTYF